MAEDKRANSLIPFTVDQNPAPVELEGQQFSTEFRALTQAILRTFAQVLPSNYVSQTTGPYYNTQFQAMAEVLARIQIQATETALDHAIDFTRPEFLWETIGTLVFPDIDDNGIPDIDGDVDYRCFLKRMIVLLLTGAKIKVQQEGVELLTDAVVTVLEKVAFQYDPITAWGFPEQFEFEINVSDTTVWTDPGTGELIEGAIGTGFPFEPFVLEKNVLIVLRALKPAHTLYDYRNLFLDAFGEFFDDSVSFNLNPYYYDDFRKYCEGAKELTGAAGVTLVDRSLFSDATRDFRNICIGAELEILTGVNASQTNGGNDAFNKGMYRVKDVLRMPLGAEITPRSYTTSPTSLSGNVTIGDDGELEDLSQDFSNAAEGEILTIIAGPNAGNYRLETLLGLNGGPVGFVTPGSGVTRVRVALSLLRLGKPMPSVASAQSYRVTVDRLGCRTPNVVIDEDASSQFYL